MEKAIKRKIGEILDAHRTMTVATLRPDGWPQATTVGYAHDGLKLYFLCGKASQKADNLARDDRVSITIDHDEDQVMKIVGLSMAAHARRVEDPEEAKRALALLIGRYPEQKGMEMAPPEASDIAFFRVEPVVISVLDYTKGFAHTDLVRC